MRASFASLALAVVAASGSADASQATPGRRIPIVMVAGCAKPTTEPYVWTLSDAGPRRESTDAGITSDEEDRARKDPLGDHSYQLVGVAEFVDAEASRRIGVRGRLLSSTRVNSTGKLADGQRGKFLAGTALAIEVQKADDSHRQAQLRVQRARVDLVEGELDLLHLRGKLLERYAAVLKQLKPNALMLDDAREPM